MLNLIFLVSLFAAKTLAKDTCVLRGMCFSKDGPSYCLDNEQARLFNDSRLLKLLQNNCPNLADINGDFYTCCDSEQVELMEGAVHQGESILGSCASCWHNYLQFLCSIVCSPVQSQFLYVHKSRQAEKTNKHEVLQLEYMMTKSFAKELFDSCVNVKTTVFGNDYSSAMDFLCDPWGRNCTTERLMIALFEKVPFRINVTLWDENVINRYNQTYKPLNATTRKCDQTSGNNSPCSCQDCAASCVGNETAVIDAPTCVWYGECGYNEKNGAALNCLDNKPARFLYKQPTNELVQELDNYCPNLKRNNLNYYLCCDEKQINTLLDSLQLNKHLMSNCPSCWYNFREFVCNLACGSDQSKFMYVQNTKAVRENNETKIAVSEVEYVLSESFANRLFNSCRNATMPVLNNTLLMDVMCGQWGAKYCTIERWLSHMGGSDNVYSPFLVNITLWDQNVVYQHHYQTYFPLNTTTYSCNEGFDNHYPCSCEDCPASCPVPGDYD